MKRIIFHCLLILFLFIIALPLFPQSDALNLFQKGLSSEQQGDLYSALFTFKKIIKINPYFTDAKVALARIYYKLKDYQKSEKTLKEVLKQEPTNIDALNLLGKVEITLNKFNEAEKAFHKVIKADRTNIDAHYGFANLYRLQGRYKDAIEKYHYILKLYPNDTRSYIYIGEIYMEMHKYKKAGGFFRNAVSLDNQSSFTHVKLSNYYYKMGSLYSTTDSKLSDDYLKAGVDEAQTALEIDQNNKDALNIMGNIFLLKKNYAAALTYYQKLLKIKPDDNILLYTIGYCYEMKGNLEKAKGNYYRALAIRRDDETDRFRLEEIAIKIYKTDLKNKLRIELSDYHYEKGKYFFSKNNLEKAFYQFKRAVQLDPLNSQKRLSFAEIFKIENYYERYLYELKNIIRDTLDVNTQVLNDKIEILENLMSKGIPAKWGVKQYLEDRNSPYYVPKSHTKIAVLNYFTVKNDKSLHKALSKTLKEYLEFFLYNYPKMNLVKTDNEIKTQEEALKTAQSINTDFYITGSVAEDTESLKIELQLRSSINGALIKNFIVYSTGNNRLFNNLFSLSEDINNNIPLQGMITKIEGENVLLNIGRTHGVKRKMNFLIIRKGSYKVNMNYDISTISKNSIVGNLTITRIGELVSEGKYQYNGIFNRVNEYDSIVYNPDENEKSQEKKQP